MDCDTARTLIGYRRPGGPPELPPDDLAALDRHLAGCPRCGPAARTRDGFDAAVAAVMTAVPVPAGLRGRVLARTAAAEAAGFRRRVGTAAAAGLAAAIAGGLILGGVRAARPGVDADGLAAAADQAADAPEAAVRDWLAAEGLPPDLPLDLDFGRRVFHGTERVAGRDAAVIVFQAWRAGRPDTLKLYLLRDDRFQVDAGRDAQSSFFTAQVVRDDRARTGVVYVALLTQGAVVEQFLKPRVPAG